MHQSQGYIDPDPQAISNVLHASAVLNYHGPEVVEVFEYMLPALLKVTRMGFTARFVSSCTSCAPACYRISHERAFLHLGVCHSVNKRVRGWSCDDLRTYPGRICMCVCM